MRFRYKLDVQTGSRKGIYEIQEPVHFTNFSVKLARGDYHGFDDEWSDTKLEFYGLSGELIRSVYEENGIDGNVVLIAEYTCNGEEWNEFYRGQIELNTYVDVRNKARYVEAKTTQDGVGSYFYNRMNTPVYLDRDELTSIDGYPLKHYNNIGVTTTLPPKEIVVQDTAKAKDLELNPFATPEHYLYIYRMMSIPFGEIGYDEFGFFVPNNGTAGDFGTNKANLEDRPDLEQIKELSPLFRLNPDTSEKLSYRNYHIKGEIKLEWEGGISSYDDMRCVLELYNPEENEYIVLFDESKVYSKTSFEFNFDLDLNATYLESDYRLYAYIVYTNREVSGERKLISNSSVKISALSEFKETISKVSLIHEALSRVAESITNSELTVKSDWLGRPDSEVNPTNKIGEGSLLAIASGLDIRNAKLTDGSDPKYSVSFNDLFGSIDAIYSLGMDLVEENGKICIRIEPWKYFYNDEVVLEINDPDEIKRTINVEEIISEFKVGYNKYLDVGETNGLDGFHTERTYVTRVKSSNTKFESISKIIGDPLVIETVRRKSLEKDTKDSNYDNEVFFICLRYSSRYGYYSVDQGGISDTGGTIISPETQYNYRISPARMAYHWASRFLNFTGSSALYPTEVIGNQPAKGKAESPSLNSQFVYGYDPGIVIGESQNIALSKDDLPIMKPETITFKYPLKIKEYLAIKQNPYGIIRVNGEDCYLKEVNFQMLERMGTFTLIPKY